MKNSGVVAAWHNRCVGSCENLSTDGTSIYSYKVFKIAEFVDCKYPHYSKVIRVRDPYFSPSKTTSAHISCVLSSCKSATVIYSSCTSNDFEPLNVAWLAAMIRQRFLYFKNAYISPHFETRKRLLNKLKASKILVSPICSPYVGYYGFSVNCNSVGYEDIAGFKYNYYSRSSSVSIIDRPSLVHFKYLIPFDADPLIVANMSSDDSVLSVLNHINLLLGDDSNTKNEYISLYSSLLSGVENNTATS